jgi:Tfp pilus assembly protein PilO
MKSQIKFWILLAFSAAFIAVYFLFGFAPMKMKIDQANASMTRTEQEIDASIQRIRQIPGMRKLRDQSLLTVENLRTRIIVSDSISSAMSRLNRLCAEYQVKIITMNFSTDSLLYKSRASGTAPNESFELPILFEFEGRFLDVGMMIEHVNRLPFMISFSDFSISTQEKSDKLKMDARASIRISSSHNEQTTKR